MQNSIGDAFLITAFTHGIHYDAKKLLKPILDLSMIDLQFYGKKESSNIEKGKLSEFDFHPANCEENDVTSVYFETCVKKAIKFQQDNGFKKIIIPNFYENEKVEDIIYLIKTINKYIKTLKEEDEEYYMTLPFANHIIIDKEKVEEILFACTDMDMNFDGYFVVCETKPEFRKKITTDIKVIRNLSTVLKTLKLQSFKTIYAYANWDAIIYLAQTDIDYLTIGSYENLRNFDISRFTNNSSGGPSKGYYFSEKLLNMVRAEHITLIKGTGNLKLVKNEKNIFSEVILKDGYNWNIHRPDINKCNLLAISRLFQEISSISDLKRRKKHVLSLIKNAIEIYKMLESKHVYLDNESSNYHLSVWKTYLKTS
ncbi:hypothetical protein [Marinifilum sp. D714]|uniref:hypothetical protein n=1 Tax=Marinifilum sp. D714 TaxID=2937523 RepID=UPI0027C19E3D|nr:hypothetical protein [Marinifilum sp. D714]MDQ2180819.1 hypothetical protein [Marinifilum sp. D714]